MKNEVFSVSTPYEYLLVLILLSVAILIFILDPIIYLISTPCHRLAYSKKNFKYHHDWAMEPWSWKFIIKRSS